MIGSLLRNKLLLVVIIIVVLAGAWYGLSSSSAPTPVLSSGTSDSSGDSTIVTNLLALQAITLSGTIFSDPAYATLKDFTTAIVPDPVGRPDPFAPLPAQSSGTSPASGKGAALFQPAP